MAHQRSANQAMRLWRLRELGLEERVELEDPFGGDLVVAHRTTSKRV